ncbi:MAG: hypothetical protein WD048_01475 [Chitinophagales bacterium]
MYRIVLLSILLLLPGAYLFAQSPVQGEDLIKALGQRQNTDLVSRLNNYIGEDHESKGAQIIISGSKLTRIDIYNDKNVLMQNMSAFKGDLPLGLKLSSTIFEAKKLLGEGYEEEGDKGGSYTLTKEFPLNELDAWQINIMYNRGRVNLVSMIFVEKGRAAAEDAEMISKTGLSGEDYFLMIRKNLYNFQVKTLLSHFGNPDYSKKNRRIYLDGGLEMQLSKYKTIEKLVMHPSGSREPLTGKTFKQFPLALPFGIKFSDNRNLIQEKCGQAPLQDGNSMTYFEQNTEMRLFFSGNTLSRVEIYKPEAEKKD